MRNVLICGHRSFAAKGLVEMLRAEGYSVTCFSRGREGRDGHVVTGDVTTLATNPHFDDSYDTVINYILLADATAGDNEAYLESLLQLCKAKRVRHLIHMSSISVYKGSVRLVHEGAETETDPSQKGNYGAVKVVQDNYLKQHCPTTLPMTLCRPGFILGAGVMNPLVGTAFRTPFNFLLGFGNLKCHIPITTRDLVNRALVKIVATPPAGREVVILADKASPTKWEFIACANHELGYGASCLSFPVWFWLTAAFFGQLAVRLVGMKLELYKIIRNACRRQTFTAVESEKRLGMGLSVDWREALKEAVDFQEKNFSLPFESVDLSQTVPLVKSIGLLGCGRIVYQKHLPALTKLDYRGVIEAYDPRPSTSGKDDRVRLVSEPELSPSELVVVATPGPVHIQGLSTVERIASRVLIEKPVSYTAADLARWKAWSESSGKPIFVCHNYRFKANVRQMMAHLEKYNPGPILHATMVFHSSPVCNDGAAWMRNERQARTLLFDYAIHCLDIATMFGRGTWQVDRVDYRINARNETAEISASIRCDNYSVDLIIRQGCVPRKAHVRFEFQNYSTSIHFFPDTFTAHMGSDNFGLYFAEGRALFKGTIAKVFDKLTGRDDDDSHVWAYRGAMGHPIGKAISLSSLQGFYDLLYELEKRVYSETLAGTPTRG
jgi:predicted dehydrogenase/nucleoside-diphosphate-sugar epimerase